MHKNNLCRLPNKILVCEESDTISQSSFNSKKCLFNQPKKEPNKCQNNNQYFNNFSKAIMKLQPTKKSTTNNIVNIKTNNNNNKINVKKKALNFLNIIKKNIILKYEKSFAGNSDIFYIGCLVNSYKISYKDIVYEYLKQYYIYSDSVKIIPKKAFYYRHHMLFLELPNFKNLYLNNLNKNNGLDKLNIYRNLNYPDKLLKINQDSNNSKESDNKVFDTNVIETLENYSTTMTQESNLEKVNSLTPLEIFRRCCDTNKNKKTYPKLKHPNQNNFNKYTKIENKKKKEEKSIITFSESEISYISKNINDDSIVSIIRNLTKKNTVKYKYNYEKEQRDFQKRYGIIKGISTSKDKKKDIVYTMKPENEKIIQTKKYVNICGNKINSNTKPKNAQKKITKINNNNKNNRSKNTKRRVSTSTHYKWQKLIFDVSHHNTYSNNESKKTSFVNNVHKYTLIEDKKSLCPSIVSKKNKGVLNLKSESCQIPNKDFKNNINFVSSSYKRSNLNTNFQDFYSIFLTPKNDDGYSPDTYQKKYLDKKKKNSFIVSKNSILFNNTNNTNIMERSQNKYKNADCSNSKSPNSNRNTENRVSQKKFIKINGHKRHMILTDLDQNKLTLSIKKINEKKNNNFKIVNVMKTQIVQKDRRCSLNVNRKYKKNCKIKFIK